MYFIGNFDASSGPGSRARGFVLRECHIRFLFQLSDDFLIPFLGLIAKARSDVPILTKTLPQLTLSDAVSQS